MIQSHLLVSNKNFSLAWVGQLVSNLGDIFYRIAYMWWITQTTGSPLLLSTVVLMSMLPGLVIGPFAGKLSDRFNPKWIMVITDLIQGAVILWVTIIAYFDDLTITHFYISSFLSSLANTFFRPANFSTISRIVEKDNLVVANSLMSFGRNVSIILGPMLSGILISTIGFKVALLTNSISFFLSAISELFLDIPKTIKKGKEKLSFVSFFKESISSLKIIFSDKVARTGILIFTGVNFMAASVNLLSFIADKIGLGADGYGMLLTSEGIGLILTSLFFSSKRLGKLINHDYLRILSMVILSLAIITISLSKTVTGVMIGMFFVGIGIGTGGILLRSALQSNLNKDILGSFAGAQFMLNDIAFPAGIFLGGYFSSIYDVSSILFVVGLLIILNVIGMYNFNRYIKYSSDS